MFSSAGHQWRAHASNNYAYSSSVKPCPHCRSDCRRKRRLSPNSATVSLFSDSVDRL